MDHAVNSKKKLVDYIISITSVPRNNLMYTTSNLSSSFDHKVTKRMLVSIHNFPVHIILTGSSPLPITMISLLLIRTQ